MCARQRLYAWPGLRRRDTVRRPLRLTVAALLSLSLLYGCGGAATEVQDLCVPEPTSLRCEGGACTGSLQVPAGRWHPRVRDRSRPDEWLAGHVAFTSTVTGEQIYWDVRIHDINDITLPVSTYDLVVRVSRSTVTEAGLQHEIITTTLQPQMEIGRAHV